jgi:hypothetical protein
MSGPCSIPGNPDISGRGVLIAVYLQNMLCFILALWALWDGEVTEYELDSVENHSLTNLILAFGILLSCVVQALSTRGVSNYQTSIILSMSWMNNTNAFIYFLLYVQRKTEEGIKPQWASWIHHIKNRAKGMIHSFDGGLMFASSFFEPALMHSYKDRVVIILHRECGMNPKVGQLRVVR